MAVPDPLWEFRLHKWKEMEANAYRTAHDPPSKEFLDACDRIRTRLTPGSCSGYNLLSRNSKAGFIFMICYDVVVRP